MHAVFALAAAAAVLVPSVAAQAGAYGQCGGIGWTGATTCVNGYTCVVSNDYYSQCSPGTATTTKAGTTTKAATTTTKPVTTVTSKTTTTAPAPTSTYDAKKYCGQYDSTIVGPYTLYLNQWGLSGATSGSQCAQLTSFTGGNTVGFTTTWTFAGGNGVKSYTNINLNQGINKVLSTIKTIPSSVKWTNTASGSIVSDVAYDLFTSTTPGGSTQNNYEIMIWLANFNAGPISYNYGADGNATPIASNLSFNGVLWNLYYGFNGWNYVYSFLPVSGTIPSFSGDLNLFLKYLTTSQKLPASQYLTTLQIGTEPTTGSATFTVSSYNAAIN